MAEARRPPPVVTIVDPRRPRPLPDAVVAPEPSRVHLPLRRDERLLAALALLLLLVGGSRASALRTDARLHSRLASLRAAAVPTGGGPVLGTTSFMVLELVIAGARDEALPLRGFRVDGGWRVTAAEPRAFGVGQRLFLRHSIDCRRPMVPPHQLSFDVAIGSAQRTLLVPLRGPVDRRVTDLAEVCGQLGPAGALLVAASSGPEPVAVELVNRGLDDLVVEQLRVDGFSLRASRALPLLLPGRAPGVLRFPSLVRTRLLLGATVTDCPRARLRLLRPGPVGALVRGRTGRVQVDLGVPEVEGLLRRAWSAACPV